MRNKSLNIKEKNELEVLKEQEEKQMYSAGNIKYRFAGYYHIPPFAEKFFFPTIAKLPHKIIDFAIKRILFITGEPDSSGAATLLITNKYRAVVYFGPKFWDRSISDIEDGIAHEIAHAYLKHRFDTDNEGKDIEKDADELASIWLNRSVTIGGVCPSSY